MPTPERISRRDFLKGTLFLAFEKALWIPKSKESKETEGDYFVSVITFPGPGEPSFYPGLAVSERLVGLGVENRSYEPPSGNILCIWDFGDGNIEERNSAQATHIWSKPGYYNLSVRVLRDGRELFEFEKELELFKLEKNSGFELAAEGNETTARGRVSKWPIVYLGGKFSLKWWEDFEETGAYLYVNDMVVGSSARAWPKGEYNDYYFENGRILPFSPQNPSKEIFFKLKPPKNGGARCKVEDYFTLLRGPQRKIEPPIRV